MRSIKLVFMPEHHLRRLSLHTHTHRVVGIDSAAKHYQSLEVDPLQHPTIYLRGRELEVVESPQGEYVGYAAKTCVESRNKTKTKGRWEVGVREPNGARSRMQEEVRTGTFAHASNINPQYHPLRAEEIVRE